MNAHCHAYQKYNQKPPKYGHLDITDSRVGPTGVRIRVVPLYSIIVQVGWVAVCGRGIESTYTVYVVAKDREVMCVWKCCKDIRMGIRKNIIAVSILPCFSFFHFVTNCLIRLIFWGGKV